MIKKLELILLKAFVFFIPYNLGIGFIADYRLIFASDIFLFLLLFLWIYRTNGLQEGKLYFGKPILPATIMVVWSIISVLFGESQLIGGIAIYMLVKAFLFYFYAINNITTRKQMKAIITFLTIGIAIQGAIGMGQKMVGGSLGLLRLGESIKSFDNNIYGMGRIVGTYFSSNRYGGHLVLVLPLVINMVMNVKVIKERYIYLGVSILATAGLFFSLSRSSWLGLIISIIAMVLVLAKRRKISAKFMQSFMIVSILIIVLIIANWNILEYRFDRGSDGTHRMTMIRIAINILSENPIFGVGLFNYQFHSYDLFKFWHPVHNTYLRLACETGIFGLILFLWFVYYALREAYRGTKIKDQFLSATALGAFGGLVAFLALVNFGPQYQHYRLKIIFWILCSLTVSIRRIRRKEVFKFHETIAKQNKNEKMLEQNRQ